MAGKNHDKLGTLAKAAVAKATTTAPPASTGRAPKRSVRNPARLMDKTIRNMRAVMADANTARSIWKKAAIGFMSTEKARDNAECALTASTQTPNAAHAEGGSPNHERDGGVPPANGSVEVVAAIDVDGLAGHRTSQIGGEKNDRVGDFVRLGNMP